ncbi:hypothetical protein DPMN_187328 [Dreissena polymorpha]|uniref:G-protein coupled receptors family 1 profile domain-containing protein n=1 Tax=Dreissena polymorpha TaxID=45954 RepID=A0A9D4DN45_DREPO|nr:hypothetical protein DPMN_187328 [Dreissena polymorpha]
MESGDSNTTANTTDMRNTSLLTENLYLEEHSSFILCASVLIGLVSLTSCILAVTILLRTRKVPKSTKNLVTALLVFDCIFVTSSTVRKFIQHPLLNRSITTFNMSSLQLAYTTVGMMSIERCLLFYSPMTNMRFYSNKFIMTVTASVWSGELGIFLLVRYGVCYLRFKSIYVFTQAQVCNNTVSIYYGILVTIVLLTSMVSYWIIFVTVRQKNSRKDERVMSFRSVINLIRGYKNTVLVLVFWVLILVTSLAYFIIILLTHYMGLGPYIVRLSLDAVSILNCLLDPFLYVLWFKECKLELLNMFSFLGKSVKEKAKLLQYEVFDIVPYETNALNRNKTRHFEGTCGVDMNDTGGHSNPAFIDETAF